MIIDYLLKFGTLSLGSYYLALTFTVCQSQYRKENLALFKKRGVFAVSKTKSERFKLRKRFF